MHDRNDSKLGSRGGERGAGAGVSPGRRDDGRKRVRRLARLSLVCILVAVMMLPAGTASAWCWRPRVYGWGYRPWCGPRVVAGYGCSSYSYSYAYRWGGYGWPVYGSCGPIFYSGCAAPAVVYGWWPGGLSVGWGYTGYGCAPFGYYGWGPFAAAAPVGVGMPAVGTLASAPAGRGGSPQAAPGGFDSIASRTRAFTSRPGAPATTVATATPDDLHAGRHGLAKSSILGRSSEPIIARPPSSGTAARMRSGKLVAAGDEHLRAGVEDRDRIADALRAYDQAARIAADLPDTHLRRAIVLTALGRSEDAQAAVRRAASIDARLADSTLSGGASLRRESSRHLPPDPVFGEHDAGAPTTLDSRSAALLARIFRGQPAPGSADASAPGGVNWIAASWRERHGESVAEGPTRDRLAAR